MYKKRKLSESGIERKGAIERVPLSIKLEFQI